MRFIITDPRYVVSRDMWSDLLHSTKFFSEDCAYPVKVSRGVILHKVEGTGVGDCGFEEGGRRICCDAGMFCVAEISNSIAAEQNVGKFYDTLHGAMTDFDRVMERAKHGGNPEEDEEECPHCGRPF